MLPDIVQKVTKIYLNCPWVTPRLKVNKTLHEANLPYHFL